MLYHVTVILVILRSFDIVTSYEVAGMIFLIAVIKTVVNIVGARFTYRTYSKILYFFYKQKLFIKYQKSSYINLILLINKEDSKYNINVIAYMKKLLISFPFTTPYLSKIITVINIETTRRSL